MSPEGPAARRRLAIAVLGGESAEISISGLRLQSTDAELITANESLSQGLGRIGPDCLLLVYRGADERIEIPVDIAVPTYLLFDAEGLTGYSRQTVAERLSVETGSAQLRALAPSVVLAIAPNDLAASYLRDSCGFRRVGVVFEGASIADILERETRPSTAGPGGSPKLSVRVEGPFDSTYSLAVVNSGLAFGIAGLEDVTCGLDVAPGDQVAPAVLAMRTKPTIAKLWTDGRRQGRVDAVIRNCYPPRPEDMNARGGFLYFFWEDSLISPEWVARFNEHLTGVMAPTRHVEKVLRDSGVVVPIGIVPCGLDTDVLAQRGVPTPIPSTAEFRFLHVSSGFPRKGVDVLLDAYFAEFSIDDDVCLVVKTFPNIHNTTSGYLDALRETHPRGPEVVEIQQDLRDYQYNGLYPACDCFVSATRCEGFGLPMAEAMAFELPVIVTDYSGHTDFCDDSTAFMVESTLVETGSHLRVPGSMWAEPSRESLSGHMRFVFENRAGAGVLGRVARARARVSQLTWQNSAVAAVDFIESTLES